MANEAWFEYDANEGGRIAYLRSRRRPPFRPFHMVELNAVGSALLFGAALPMAALLFFLADWPMWLSIVASLILTITFAIVLDRRKEAASWVGHGTDLTEAELLLVQSELQTLGIEVELSREIIEDFTEKSGETELVLRHRHRDRLAVEQALAARRRDL